MVSYQNRAPTTSTRNVQRQQAASAPPVPPGAAHAMNVATSIAVLSLLNVSGDLQQEFVSDGI